MRRIKKQKRKFLQLKNVKIIKNVKIVKIVSKN